MVQVPQYLQSKQTASTGQFRTSIFRAQAPSTLNADKIVYKKLRDYLIRKKTSKFKSKYYFYFLLLFGPTVGDLVCILRYKSHLLFRFLGRVFLFIYLFVCLFVLRNIFFPLNVEYSQRFVAYKLRNLNQLLLPEFKISKFPRRYKHIS